MSINSFISNFKSGYRPNRFEVEIDGIDNKLKFLCRSTSLPESSVGKISIPYQGMNIPIAGDRAEQPDWTVEIFIDDFTVREEFENWMETIRPQEVPGGTDTVGYIRNATIDLLDTAGNIIRSYKMLRCFPTSIGEIALSQDSTDTIGTFTVTFAFSGWSSL